MEYSILKRMTSANGEEVHGAFSTTIPDAYGAITLLFPACDLCLPSSWLSFDVSSTSEVPIDFRVCSDLMTLDLVIILRIGDKVALLPVLQSIASHIVPAF